MAYLKACPAWCQVCLCHGKESHSQTWAPCSGAPRAPGAPLFRVFTIEILRHGHIVHLSYQYKKTMSWVIYKPRHLFLTVLEPRRSKIKTPAEGCQYEPILGSQTVIFSLVLTWGKVQELSGASGMRYYISIIQRNRLSICLERWLYKRGFAIGIDYDYLISTDMTVV